MGIKLCQHVHIITNRLSILSLFKTSFSWEETHKLCLKISLAVSFVGFILGAPLLMAISFWLEHSHKAVAAYHHPNAASIDHILLGIIFYLVLLYHNQEKLNEEEHQWCRNVSVFMLLCGCLLHQKHRSSSMKPSNSFGFLCVSYDAEKNIRASTTAVE